MATEGRAAAVSMSPFQKCAACCLEHFHQHVLHSRAGQASMLHACCCRPAWSSVCCRRSSRTHSVRLPSTAAEPQHAGAAPVRGDEGPVKQAQHQRWPQQQPSHAYKALPCMVGLPSKVPLFKLKIKHIAMASESCTPVTAGLDWVCTDCSERPAAHLPAPHA